MLLIDVNLSLVLLIRVLLLFGYFPLLNDDVIDLKLDKISIIYCSVVELMILLSFGSIKFVY